MSEQTVDTPVVDAPVVETPVVAEQATVVNSDGTFTETWKESLSEGIRNAPCFDHCSSLNDLATQHFNLNGLLGKDKMAIPNEESSETEWTEFHKIGGMPETPQDYNLKKPDDYPAELFSDELAGKAQELFHKIGLSTKQADALMEFNLNATLGQYQDMNNASELQQKETEEGLHKDWGKAYEQNIHLGNIAVEKGTGGDEEFRARLTGKYGNDPDFIRFSSNLGKEFAEASGAPQTIPTPIDIKDTIAEEMAKPSYINSADPQHKAQVDKVQRLFAQIHPGMK